MKVFTIAKEFREDSITILTNEYEKIYETYNAEIISEDDIDKQRRSSIISNIKSTKEVDDYALSIVDYDKCLDGPSWIHLSSRYPILDFRNVGIVTPETLQKISRIMMKFKPNRSNIFLSILLQSISSELKQIEDTEIDFDVWNSLLLSGYVLFSGNVDTSFLSEGAKKFLYDMNIKQNIRVPLIKDIIDWKLNSSHTKDEIIDILGTIKLNIDVVSSKGVRVRIHPDQISGSMIRQLVEVLDEEIVNMMLSSNRIVYDLKELGLYQDIVRDNSKGLEILLDENIYKMVIKDNRIYSYIEEIGLSTISYNKIIVYPKLALYYHAIFQPRYEAYDIEGNYYDVMIGVPYDDNRQRPDIDVSKILEDSKLFYSVADIFYNKDTEYKLNEKISGPISVAQIITQDKSLLLLSDKHESAKGMCKKDGMNISSLQAVYDIVNSISDKPIDFFLELNDSHKILLLDDSGEPIIDLIRGTFICSQREKRHTEKKETYGTCKKNVWYHRIDIRKYKNKGPISILNPESYSEFDEDTITKLKNASFKGMKNFLIDALMKEVKTNETQQDIAGKVRKNYQELVNTNRELADKLIHAVVKWIITERNGTDFLFNTGKSLMDMYTICRIEKDYNGRKRNDPFEDKVLNVIEYAGRDHINHIIDFYLTHYGKEVELHISGASLYNYNINEEYISRCIDVNLDRFWK